MCSDHHVIKVVSDHCMHNGHSDQQHMVEKEFEEEPQCLALLHQMCYQDTSCEAEADMKLLWLQVYHALLLLKSSLCCP